MRGGGLRATATLFSFAVGRKLSLWLIEAGGCEMMVEAGGWEIMVEAGSCDIMVAFLCFAL